jgi:uncharacterized membrane protein
VLDKLVEQVGQLLRTAISVQFLIFSYSHFVFQFNLARIITNLIQTKDMSMVINLLISFILNISIVIACTIYANGPKPKSADTRKKKTT